MAKGKYGSRIIQNGATWTAEITRRISARKTGVSKREEGFSSEVDAQAWVEKELPNFLKTLGEQNKRRAAERALAAEKAEASASEEEDAGDSSDE